MRRDIARVLVNRLFDRALNEPMSRVHKAREREEGTYVAVLRNRELISVPQFKKFSS